MEEQGKELEVKGSKELDAKLPLMQRKFLKYYLDCGNASEAAKKAGYKEANSIYKVIGSDRFKDAFRQLLDKNSLGDKRIIDKLNELLEANKVISANVIAKDGEGMSDANSMTKDFIEVPDNPTRMKALELLTKVKQIYDDGETNTAPDTTNIIIINPQQRGSEHNGPTIHIDAETGPCV